MHPLGNGANDVTWPWEEVVIQLPVDTATTCAQSGEQKAIFAAARASKVQKGRASKVREATKIRALVSEDGDLGPAEIAAFINSANSESEDRP